MSDETLTHAVTRPQPEAWALAAGHCPVINSDTRPPLEAVGKLIGIHASRHWIGIDEAKALEPALGRKVTTPEVMAMQVRGALVGVARLVGVVRRSSPHERERLGYGEFRSILGRGGVTCEVSEDDAAKIRPWVPTHGAKWLLFFRDAVLLPEPIPMRGAGGLWRIPFDAAWRPEEEGPADFALRQWQKARATR